jgi:hypothetical protein
VAVAAVHALIFVAIASVLTATVEGFSDNRRKVGVRPPCEGSPNGEQCCMYTSWSPHAMAGNCSDGSCYLNGQTC